MLKKRFGQHFLTDENILKRIVNFAKIQPDDNVLEIGPGAGSLTRALAAAARRVVAIEIDRELIDPLRSSAPANVELIEADALQVDLSRVFDEPFHLVGNLPYNVATPLFKRFIGFRRRILDVTVMIQKEVADRIIARPDDDAYGPLSILIQYYAVPEYGFTVRPGAFRPRPKVDSAIIRLEWRAAVPDATAFTDFVHDAFGSRRKKLINNLDRMFPRAGREKLLEQLRQADVPSDARPENLSVEAFHRLYNQICTN